MMVLQQTATGGVQLFDDWSSVARIAVHAGVIYIFIVAALRIAGQRALAKMSGYDMIVTVALGSLVAGIATSPDITVVDGLTAVITFLLLQQITSWLQARSRHVHHAVRERPQVMLWNGRFLQDNLREASITEDEVRAAIRRTGKLSLSEVQCVVLENDGEWSVMGRSDAPDLSALEGLRLPYDLPAGGDPAEWRDSPDDLPARRSADRPVDRSVERAADDRNTDVGISGPV